MIYGFPLHSGPLPTSRPSSPTYLATTFPPGDIGPIAASPFLLPSRHPLSNKHPHHQHPHDSFKPTRYPPSGCQTGRPCIPSRPSCLLRTLGGQTKKAVRHLLSSWGGGNACWWNLLANGMCRDSNSTKFLAPIVNVKPKKNDPVGDSPVLLPAKHDLVPSWEHSDPQMRQS